jgi:hypothetical protein
VHNAVLQVDDNLLFDMEDPQILIEESSAGDIESLIFRFQFLSLGDEVLSDLLRLKEDALSAIKAEKAQVDSGLHIAGVALQAKDQEIQRLREQLRHKEEVMDQIIHSRSWKVTKPLRILTGLFHGGVDKNS